MKSYKLNLNIWEIETIITGLATCNTSDPETLKRIVDVGYKIRAQVDMQEGPSLGAVIGMGIED